MKNKINYFSVFVAIAIILLLCFTGCEKKQTEDVITTYDIVMGKYTSFVEGIYDKELVETLELTYIDKDGNYITVSVDPSYRISFGDDNKVLYTNEDSIWGYRDYILTNEAYNKIVSSSPQVVDIRK